MRIENYNAIAQNKQTSSNGKIGNVSLPDYSDFHYNTKSAPAMSDDKYKEAIIEQAKKDQAVGKFQSESAGYKSLIKSYVSAVSPDRKSIIANGLTAIFKNNKPQTKTLNLLDYMFGTVKYNKEAADVSYAEFYDKNGEMVASYSNGGWTFYGTKAEDARESEAWGIYNEAWNNAARQSRGSNSFIGQDTMSSSIDVVG